MPLLIDGAITLFFSNVIATGKTTCGKGSFLDYEYRDFDPGAFALPADEISPLDPQQRLVLEVGWEALELAGMNPLALSGESVGVYIGGFTEDHLVNQYSGQARSGLGRFSAAGSPLTMLANRLSYVLDLRGPGTGMGALPAYGAGREVFEEGLFSARSGIRRIESIDADALNCHFGAQIDGFPGDDLIRKSKRQFHYRVSLMAMAAADEAFRHAGLNHREIAAVTGAMMGSAFGPGEAIQDSVLRIARAGGQDPGFVPAETWQYQPFWQSEPLAELAHARIELAGSRQSADNRLSAPSGAWVRIVVRKVRADPKWPGVVQDWEQLRSV